MTSSKLRGTTSAKTEVSHISAHGIGLLCRDRDFVPFVQPLGLLTLPAYRPLTSVTTQ